MSTPTLVRIVAAALVYAVFHLLAARAYAGAWEAECRERAATDHSTTPRTER